jgi:hypothetical protein
MKMKMKRKRKRRSAFATVSLRRGGVGEAAVKIPPIKIRLAPSY